MHVCSMRASRALMVLYGFRYLMRTFPVHTFTEMECNFVQVWLCVFICACYDNREGSDIHRVCKLRNLTAGRRR